MSEFIPVAAPDLSGNERRYVAECVESGWISCAGPFVRRFEQAFAALCGVRHAVSTSSGTTALQLALASLGIGRGDEVLVPAWTFVATANAVVHAGARPILVDVEPEGWGIDPAQAARKLTRRTRAIVAVHLYGRPADVRALGRLARREGVRLVEDAAEAHGADVGGRRVGAWGDVGCFSFFANKIVTTGEGGILVTRSRRLAEIACRLRDHGMGRKKYWHPVVGYSYAMSSLQAAVGLAQLERFDTLIKRKDAIAQRYAVGLAEVPGIEVVGGRPGTRSVCWMVSVLVDGARFGMSRDALIKALAARGVDTRPFFYPLHMMPPYRSRERFPVAERIARRGLNLPSGPAITEAQIDRVVDAIRAVHRRGR